MKRFPCVLAVTFLLGCCGFSAAAEKLNLLLITVDDMSADSVGAFGCRLADTTPNIDRLARQGMRFLHAHVQVANCKPSRNVMWSGRYPHNNRVEGFYQVKNPGYPVLVDLMKQAGYFTAIRHKVSHSTPYHPYAWDLVLDTLPNGTRAHVKDPKSYGVSTDRGIRAARAAGKPFCLLINISDPHKPFYAQARNGATIPDPHVPSRVFTPEEPPIPGFLFADPVVSKELAHYYSSVRRADDAVGSILQALEDAGETDNTLVLFLSDHGMPLPFAKTQLYHHSTHTPLIVRWPGVTKPGAVDDQHMVSAVDILPTLLDAVGLEHPEGLDGRSFAPLLRGEKQDGRNLVIKEYNENAGGSRDPMRAVQTKRFLYIFNPWSNGKRVMATATTGTPTYRRMAELAKTNRAIAARDRLYRYRVVEELYDVQNDPDCLVNLIDSPAHQAELNRLRQALEAWMVKTGDHMLDAFRNRNDPAAREAYVQQKEREAEQRKKQRREGNRGRPGARSRRRARENVSQQKASRPGGHGTPATCELASPDGRIVARLRLTGDGRLRYAMDYRGKPIVADSALGLVLADCPPLESGFRLIATSRRSDDSTWRPVYGERSQIRDRYNELIVDLEDSGRPPRRLRLAFRAYNEGLALAYIIPKQPALEHVRITSERTEFRFTGDWTTWAVYSAQGRYQEVPLSQVKPGCERPLVLEVDGETFVAVAEARLVDYARMKLAPLTGTAYALVSQLHGEVEAELPLVTPWRVIMVAPSPGKLLENNHIILNLNDPCAIDDVSWIIPGKVIREVTLTTRGGKACVDFAAEHNLQYVEFDAGWYGHEYSEQSDATTVTVDPKRSPGPLDLKEVIRYAEQRGVGIILYVNRRALERQLDTILPLYQQWGVRGVKYGFVNVGSQKWTAWLHEAVRKAAEHRLMVDIHDEYRPTGYSRTYPNLMTQEGIAGDETRPTNRQTLTILFTRMLAGAGDNTICYYDPRVDENACHAYQLAKAVCLYSPWQFLFWYDRPAASRPGTGAAGRNVIGDEPELEFFDHLPTVWDDTRVLHGQIGRYAAIARRSGADWFVGVMNDEEPRTLRLVLDFLEPGKQYTAHIYSHDPNVSTRTHVRIERRPVDAATVLTAQLGRNGGQALWIECQKPE